MITVCVCLWRGYVWVCMVQLISFLHSYHICLFHAFSWTRLFTYHLKFIKSFSFSPYTSSPTSSLLLVYFTIPYVRSTGEIISCVLQRSQQEVPHTSFLPSLHAWREGTLCCVVFMLYMCIVRYVMYVHCVVLYRACLNRLLNYLHWPTLIDFNFVFQWTFPSFSSPTLTFPRFLFSPSPLILPHYVHTHRPPRWEWRNAWTTTCS